MPKSLLTFGTSSGTFKTMDEVLENLVREAQRQAPQTEGRHRALTRLVDEMLRSRPICRPPGSQPLLSVQGEIYEQTRQQLLQEINQQLDQYNPERLPVRTWVNTLRNKAFSEVLDDAQLKKLALTAQQYQPHTQLRQHLLGELLEAIRLSGKLCRPHREKFSPNFYELLYEEAVIETLLYVCKNIDKYDPERGKDKKFITWVNFRLDKQVIECRRQFSPLNTQDLPSLTDMEMIEQPEEPPSLCEIVRQFIEKDAENIFRQARIRNRPDANFRAIALARFSGRSWEEISAELGIVVPTLSCFFQRCCRKFAPHFQNYLQT